MNLLIAAIFNVYIDAKCGSRLASAVVPCEKIPLSARLTYVNLLIQLIRYSQQFLAYMSIKCLTCWIIILILLSLYCLVLLDNSNLSFERKKADKMNINTIV